MKRTEKIFLIALIWSTWTVCVHGQNEIDSLYRMNVDTVDVDSIRIIPDSIPYLALDSVHQRRYLPKGEEFRTPHLWQRLFFGFSSGLYGLTDKSWQRTNVPVAFSMGYEFNRYSALRLTGSYVEMPHNNLPRGMRTLGGDVDYIFNLTDYLYGFRPVKNHFNFGLVPGVGLIVTRNHQDLSKLVSFYLQAHMGFHFGYTLGYNTEIYAEPWFGLSDDNANYSEGNPSVYDVIYGVRLGASIRLRPRPKNDPDSTNHRPFFEFSQGLVLPVSSSNFSVHHLGTGYQLSIGEWINPVFGLRLGFSGEQYYWDKITKESVVVDEVQVHPEIDTWQGATCMAGRLELLFNFLNMSQKGRQRADHRKVDFNFAFGAEAGWHMKYGVPNSRDGLRQYYYGLSFAPQLLYAFSPRNSLFVEPRLLMANYRIPYSNSPEWKTFSDKILTLQAGVRLQPLTPNERKRLNKDFVPSVQFSAALGGAKLIRHDKTLGDFHLNGFASLAASVELAPLLGLRLRAEYLNFGFNRTCSYVSHDLPTDVYSSALFNHNYHILSTKLGYLMNANNLIQGFDADRRLNAYIEVGPMYGWNLHRGYSFCDGELRGGSDITLLSSTPDVPSSFGTFVGLLVDYRINPSWSVQANTEMSFYLRRNFLNQSFGQPLGNWLTQLSVGAAYRLPW